MVRLTDGAELLKCPFYGRSQERVRELIGGSGAYIHDECIELYDRIVEKGLGEESTETSPTPLPMPHEIKEFLDSWVIGQDRAKHTLSATMYNYYKRTRSHETGNEEDMLGVRSSILLLGPMGTGKTYLMCSLARLLHIPFMIADATVFAEAGYVGKDVENTLLRLIQEADGDIKRAKHDIIYVDEIDKIGCKDGDTSTVRDVSGGGAQQALLKIIEGTVASVPPQGRCRHPHQQFLEVDASRIPSIAAGALAGTEDIAKARIKQRSIGSGSDLESKAEVGDLYGVITPKDLHRSGMVPEFIGCLLVLTSTKKLAEEGLMEVLTGPENSLLRQHQYLFELDGIDLEFTHEVLLAITTLTNECKTGTRDLSSITGRILSDLMSKLPSRDDVTRIVVVHEYVEGTREPGLYAQRGGDIRSA